MTKSNAQKKTNANPTTRNDRFAVGDFVNYPANGIGVILGVETLTIGGVEATFYSINFEKDRMRVKIPMERAIASGLRKLSTPKQIEDAIATMKGRARVRRVMWSRRAAEYEAKINSGDPVLVAEVLRDLKRCANDEEQSYSERQVYQSALERLGREVAAIEDLEQKTAESKLEDILRGKKKKSADIVALPIKDKTDNTNKDVPMEKAA
jgi:CarD family transcriptional regulator